MTTSMVGLKNGHIHKILTQNCESQRYSWEHRRRRKPPSVALTFVRSYPKADQCGPCFTLSSTDHDETWYDIEVIQVEGPDRAGIARW